MLDKNPFIIDDFGGINRGSENHGFGIEYQDQIPFTDAIDCSNIAFLKEGGIQTRPPLRVKIDLWTDAFDPVTGASDPGGIRQYWKIARLGSTYYDNRWLYVTRDDSANILRVYDSANIVVIDEDNTPIAKIVGAKYASVINIYGRIYLSPLTDFGTPLTGSAGVIYTYDGTTWRQAGGTAPTGGTLTITDTAVGGANVTPGLHIGAIAFETASGFITPAGPATRIQVTIAATGGRAARFANVDTGPAGTVARHLLLTKSIPTYDGIQDNWELFFALRIPNNTATTGDVVLPDTGLVDSADYLLSEFASIPACAMITKYNTHLMYNGANTDSRVIYVSKGNDPETVDQTEDYIQNFDGIPVDIYIGKELRGAYYFFKANSTYVVREDVNSPPNAWEVNLVDSGLGASPMGIAEVMANPGGLVLDNIIVAGESGIYVFSGAFSHLPISYKIQGLFDNATKAQLKYIRMVVDPTKRRLYFLFGDFTNLFVLWYGDYYRGLDPQNMRWTTWAFAWSGEAGSTKVFSMSVDPNNGSATNKPNVNWVPATVVYMVEPREDLVPNWDKFDPPAVGSQEISWYYETGYTSNPLGILYTFSAMILRIALKLFDDGSALLGTRTVNLTVTPFDTTTSATATNTVSPEEAPAKMYQPLAGDIVNEKVRVKVAGKGAMFMTKLALMVAEKAQMRPR